MCSSKPRSYPILALTPIAHIWKYGGLSCGIQSLNRVELLINIYGGHSWAGFDLAIGTY